MTKIRKFWISREEYEGGISGGGTGYYSKPEIDAFFEGESSNKKQVHWDRVTSKPSTYPPDAHTLASHSTKAHSELSDAPVDAHHSQLHATSHEATEADELNHDNLAGFEAAEHLSLPNTIANVLSNHTKEVHDSLDIDARYIDGQEVVAVNPSNNEVLTYVFAETRWEAKTVPAGTLAGLTDTNIGAPENGEFLQYFDSDSKWHNISAPAPSPHASTHHTGGSDLVNHDSLTGFVGAEHLSLPNTIANVLNNHNKEVHDALDIDARYIDGKEVVAATPTDGHVLMYVLANTRWEDKPIGASVSLADLSDTNIGALENGDLLEYWTSDSKWHNVVRFPDTIANILSDHTLATHNALSIDHGSLSGRGDDDHTIYYNSARHTVAVHNSLSIDHGSLGGRTHDDHTQYLLASGARALSAAWDAGGYQIRALKFYSDQATGVAPFTVLSTTKVGNLNVDRCDDKHVAEASTVSTIVARNSAGDINARLFKSEYDTYNPTCNYIMTQIDTASNNYIRPSTKAQLIASLNLMTKAGGAFTGLVTARDHGTASVDEIVGVCYGTGSPPTANTTTIGTLFVKYTT